MNLITLLATFAFGLSFAGPAHAADIGFGIHLGQSRGTWDRPLHNDWHHDYWYRDRPFERGLDRRGPLGFEITRPGYDRFDRYDRYDRFGYDRYDSSWERWHDPLPEWPGTWDGPTHWGSGDTRFEYRAEPIRPFNPPPAGPKSFVTPSRRSAPEPEAKPLPKAKTRIVRDEDTDEEEEDEATLRYCASARGYYPAVRECPEGFTTQKGVKVR